MKLSTYTGFDLPNLTHEPLQAALYTFLTLTILTSKLSIITALGQRLPTQTQKNLHCERQRPYNLQGLFHVEESEPTHLSLSHPFLPRILPAVISQDEGFMLSVDSSTFERVNDVRTMSKSYPVLVSMPF